MKKRKLFIFIVLSLLLTSCGNLSSNTGSGGQNTTSTDERYTITWKNYDGTLLEVDEKVKKGVTPTYDGPTPTKATDETYTYTFSGWDPEIAPVTSNQTYTATYSYEKIKTEYVINFNLNGGSSPSYSGSKTVETFSKDIFFFDCVKEGWNFRGWSYNGTKIFDEKGNQLANPTMAKTMTFIAIYAQTAKMTIISNLEGAGNISGEGEYPYNTYVDVSAYANQGYVFVGWYYQNTLLSNTNDYKYMMWSEDVTLEARFKLDTYLINVHTNNEEYGLVLIKNAMNSNSNFQPEYSVYRDYKTSITIAAYSRTDVRFLGWYDTENKLVETNAVYSFIMPNYDYTLEAKWNYFTIDYELNGGSNNSSNPTSYTINSNKITLEEPTRSGYDFVGWTYNGKTVTEVDPLWIDNITLIANWRTNTYFITYELNGGTNNSSNPTSYTIESSTFTLKEATRNGYTFAGWYQTAAGFSNKITSINKGTYGNLTLYAKWKPISYSITYNLDGGTNPESNPSTYTIESSFTLASPTKQGYTFLGWFNNNDEQVTSINAGTTGAILLTAHWNEGNAYTITLDPTGGVVSETLINVNYDHTYFLPSPTKLGYTFEGWFDGSTQISNDGTWKYTTSKTLTAHWKIINYEINYTLNGGTNNSSNPLFYTVEDNVTFASPTKQGYAFLGWYNQDDIVTGIPTGSTGTINIEARWNANLNNLSVTSEDESKGTVSITFGTGYSGESITVVAIPVDDCVFKGWYHKSTKVSNDATYAFTMPTNDYSLVAHFFTKAEEEQEKWNNAHGGIPTISEDSKTLTYGLYPQTKVKDATLISSLNALSTPESNGWYLYEGDYYAKTTTAERPFDSHYVFNDGTYILSGATYWFKCMPIKWNILSNNDGEYYLLSSVLLDAHCYYNSTEDRIIDGETISPNNYKYSDIRLWLNEDFYNSAFALGNEYIQTTNVDNSASTTNSSSNSYACGNTQDKVFLPSYKDYINYGFSTSSSSSTRGRCIPTDWAKARGAYYNALNIGIYWTRSPYSDYSKYVWHLNTADVDGDGGNFLYYYDFYGTISAAYSVRPSITIKIS